MDTIMATQTPTSNNFRLNGVAMAAMLMGLGWIFFQGSFLNQAEPSTSTYVALTLIGLGFFWQVSVFLIQAVNAASVRSVSVENSRIIENEACDDTHEMRKPWWEEDDSSPQFNPATGLTMFGSVDALGNPYGTNNNRMFD